MKKITIIILMILLICGCTINKKRANEFWDENVRSFPEEKA